MGLEVGRLLDVGDLLVRQLWEVAVGRQQSGLAWIGEDLDRVSVHSLGGSLVVLWVGRPATMSVVLSMAVALLVGL